MKIFLKSLVLSLVYFCFIGFLFSEIIDPDGNYGTSGTVNGDLVVIGERISVEDGNDLVVHGDVKVIDGRLRVGSDTLTDGASLTVFGDVIVINTTNNPPLQNPERADIRVNGDIFVSGSIYTRSEYYIAEVVSYEGSITAGSIHTHGAQDAMVRAKDFINVKGDIVARSDTGCAYVRGGGNNSSYIYAKSITTDGKLGSYLCLEAGGDIKVQDEIRLRSTDETATITTKNGSIEAGVISTDANTDAFISIWGSGDLDVRGSISTYSATDDAWIYVENGDLFADYIYTDGYATSSIILEGSGKNISVNGEIFAQSRNNASSITVEGGDLYAESITTSGYSDSSSVRLPPGSGGLYCKGPIIASNATGFASVFATSDRIEAGSIFTLGQNDSYVYAGSGLEVNGPIVTHSYTNSAAVHVVSGDLKAEEIFTHGYEDAYVLVEGSGNVEVRGDIFTKSDTESAYVNITSGRLSARDIRIECPNTKDDSISISDSATFGLIPRQASNTKIEISNSAFHFNADQVWDTQLELSGSCTFDGDGKMLSFDTGGYILVQSGSSVLLRNMKISNVSSNLIRCADSTATVSLQNVEWYLDGDYTFDTGKLDIVGDFIVHGGPSIDFNYQTGTPGKIWNGGSLYLDNNITFNYSCASATNLELEGQRSKIVLTNNSTFDALNDCTIVNGMVFTRGVVSMGGSSGNTLDISGIDRLFINGSIKRIGAVVMP